MKLVTPSLHYQESYIQMISEYSEHNEPLIPFVLAEDYGDFPLMVNKLDAYSRGQLIPKGFIAHSSFWLIDENERVVGCSNLRHKLNKHLLVLGGHIGFGIRPSERQKGYAKLILELTLSKAKNKCINNVLLTVDKDNLGSVKAIQYNKGVLTSEKEVSGQNSLIQYYWIEI